LTDAEQNGNEGRVSNAAQATRDNVEFLGFKKKNKKTGIRDLGTLDA
jgi:hypothetical protein